MFIVTEYAALRKQNVTDKTYGRTDNVKTVYPPQTKFAGGIITAPRPSSCADNQTALYQYVSPPNGERCNKAKSPSGFTRNIISEWFGPHMIFFLKKSLLQNLGGVLILSACVVR